MLAGEMRQGIKLRNLNGPDEDQMIQFEITASNGHTVTSQMFYGYKDSFVNFGSKLLDFPKKLDDKVTYELGEEKGKGLEKYSYYLLLSAFCYDSAGHTAIQIIVNNNLDAPKFLRCEFYLNAEPASLNKLGQGLRGWDPEHDNEFEWFSFSELNQ